MQMQKKDRKQQELFKDGGDKTRRSRKEAQPYVPRDRGDVRRNSAKKTKQELIKTKEEARTEVVARSTNTYDSPPSRFQDRKNMDVSPDGWDFRKRIKDRYTFKQYLKDNVRSQFNNASRHDAKNEPPNLSCSAYTENQKTKDFRDAKKSEKASVHRAVSALKLKRTSKSDEAARKLPAETEKNTNSRKEKRPVIKTITSKMDSRVYKAVTFVEQPARKPLHIKIPNKDMKTKPQSKIPICRRNNVIRIVSGTTQSTIRSAKRVVRRPRLAPTQKSADFQPTEIAIWAPESIDRHTQPYYEAWVSKTATASTKLVKEASIEKSKVLRSLELDARPELMVKYAAEEHAGRIRVRRRGDK